MRRTSLPAGPLRARSCSRSRSPSGWPRSCCSDEVTSTSPSGSRTSASHGVFVETIGLPAIQGSRPTSRSCARTRPAPSPRAELRLEPMNRIDRDDAAEAALGPRARLPQRPGPGPLRGPARPRWLRRRRARGEVASYTEKVAEPALRLPQQTPEHDRPASQRVRSQSSRRAPEGRSRPLKPRPRGSHGPPDRCRGTRPTRRTRRRGLGRRLPPGRGGVARPVGR